MHPTIEFLARVQVEVDLDDLDEHEIGRLIDEFPAHWWAGENVLVTFGAGGTATQLWLDSLGHRANLLATNATHMAVAVHCGGDGRLWATVQLVENRQAPTSTPTFVPSADARQLSCGDSPLSSIGATPWAPFVTADAFVEQQYRDFLGRSPDAAGRAYWTTVLERGEASPTKLVQLFLESDEFGSRVTAVNRLYLAAFGRNPTAAELDYWAAEMGRGRSLAELSNFFAASTEFTNRYGALSDREFVELVYTNVLERDPANDQEGVNFWTSEITNGRRSRGQVMIGFSESSEFKAKAGDVTVAPG